MRPAPCAAAALLLASSAALAHVTPAMGRTPKPQRGAQAARLWEDRGGAFALSRPDGERWAFKSGVRPGTVMPQLAKGYSDAQIDALAGYFAQVQP